MIIYGHTKTIILAAAGPQPVSGYNFYMLNQITGLLLKCLIDFIQVSFA